jgi:hypothetical protein
MTRRGRPSYLLALILVIAACGRIETVASSEPQTMINAPPNASTADFTPISALRPAARSYRQRYLSDIAPLIVHCMNDLGWEATYDPQIGVFLPELPFSQERELAMSFCVAGSRTNRGIYTD